jgi:hypothetical protein
MAKEVDAIVAALPPPGKLGAAADDDEGEEYNPEEEAAMAVAKALGISTDKVDVPALCSALRDFNATSSSPGPLEE